jgi:hypothetical protein
MAKNNYLNEAAVTSALASAANPDSSVKNFTQALIKYGEAIVYSSGTAPENRASFNKTVTRTIGDFNYTFSKFETGSINSYNPDPGYGTDYPDMVFSPNPKGPVIFNMKYIFGMPPNSVIVQSKAGWQNVTGDLSVTITEANNPDVKLYLLVK